VARDRIAILFSGGMDSTWAAVWALERFRQIHLITYQTDVHRFIDNSRVHAVQLAERYGADRCLHRVIPIHGLHRSIREGFAADYDRYCAGRAAGIMCMGCKLAMHARTILYCVENGVGTAADGALRGQSDHPECMPDVLNSLRRIYASYDVRFLNPVYETARKSDIVESLRGLGLTSGVRIGQSSRTDQPVCLVGPFVTMWKFSAPVDEARMVAFVEDKRPVVDRYVRGEAARLGIVVPAPDPANPATLPGDDVPAGARWTEWEFGYPWDVIISYALTPLWLAVRAWLKLKARLARRRPAGDGLLDRARRNAR
jgi:hypothetical protein